MSRSRLTDFPEPQSGYPLNSWDIAVVQAAAAVNLVTNPSIERATTGYTAVGGSIARSATRQRRGAYSLAVTPTAGASDGAYYGTFSLTSGTLYFGSFDFWGAPGVTYRAYFATAAGAQVGTAVTFRGRGKWERISLSYQETSTTTRRLYVVKDNHASTAVFYVDGLQVEADQLTTYLDGDMRGYVKNVVDYFWTGTPHASTSQRAATTRSGGIEMNLSRFGFNILGILGFGLSGLANLTTPNAYLGGSQYERTIVSERALDVAGAFAAGDPLLLDSQIADLQELLSPGAAILQQPVLLKIQRVSERSGKPLGEPCEVPCLYAGGLERNLTNYFQERAVLSFTLHLPYAARMDGSVGAALDWQDSLASADYALRRNAVGVWSILPSLNGQVQAILPLPDGTWALGGGFTNAGGDANADRLVRYDPTTDTFSAFNATPLNGSVLELVLKADGNVLVGGGFTNAGGDANADYLAELNLTTGAFSAVNATPLTNPVFAIMPMIDGNFAVGGAFTDAGGDVNADYLCRLNGATGAYSAFNATPLNGNVEALARASNGQIYIGGSFTDAGGDANADYIARINLSTDAYEALTSSAPLTAIVRALAVGLDGRIYLGGGFDNAGGNANADRIAVYNGSSFEGLSSGIAGGDVYSIVVRSDGTLMISGTFTTAGGLTVDRIVGWNGSAFFFGDVDLPVSPVVYVAPEMAGSGTIIGYNTAGTALTAAVTTITNPGNADAYPVIEFVGPGSVYQLRNYTTGSVLYFNLILLDGERATLNLEPGSFSFVSDFRGNLLNTILPGSSFNFRLAPGDNSISAFVAGTTGAGTAVALQFRPAYASLEGSLYR